MHSLTFFSSGIVALQETLLLQLSCSYSQSDLLGFHPGLYTLLDMVCGLLLIT